MEKAKFEDLRVYQQALQLLDLVYIVTKAFPKEELYGLTSQLRRAALSIVLNIAEGQGRGTKADNRNFLMISRGSLYEVLAITEVVTRQSYLSKSQQEELRSALFSILKQVNNLIAYLSK